MAMTCYISYINEYTMFFILFGISLLFSWIALLLNKIIRNVSQVTLNFEKVSTYECGFNPFEEARQRFHVHYYIVGLMFLIFDIELIFFIPYVSIFQYLTGLHLLQLFFFSFILVIGYIYELFYGLLEW